MLTVFIPASSDDVEEAKALARTLKAPEVLIETDGSSIAECRNIGASKALGDELLFLDSDVILPDGPDLSTLSAYGWEMATCYFFSDEGSGPFDPIVMLYQNWMAELGLPAGFFGGYMFMKRRVFDRVGGFRNVPGEDVEFAHRAWLLGIRIGTHPFRAIHPRPYHWKNAIGDVVTRRGEVWGFP